MDALCLRILLVALATIFSGCFSPVLHRFETSQVFQPMKYPEGEWNPEGVEFEDAFFQAADRTHLHGWFLPHREPRGVVLFAHGNAGNLTHRLELVHELRERHQVSIMVFDYRGYGRSAGKPTEAGLIQDARAARRWLANRTGIEESEIVLLGRSLGGGVMVDLAANDGAQALVLMNTFNSMVDVAEHHFSVLPADRIMQNRFDSISKIGRYEGPLLQTHGDADKLIPIEYALELFGAAKSPKQFVVAAGDGHNDYPTEEFHQAFERLLRNLERRGNVAPANSI